MQSNGGSKRLLFLLDTANVFYGFKEYLGHGSKVDFQKLRQEAIMGRKFTSTRCIAYVTLREGKIEEQRIVEVLKALHYEVKTRQIVERHGKLLHTDTDTMLGADALELQADTVVVASGDSDLIPFYDVLRRRGTRVEVMAVPGSLSGMIYDHVDEVRLLEAGVLYEPSERAS